MGRPLVPKVTALEIKIVSLIGIDREARPVRGILRFVVAEGQLDFVGHLLRDFVLQGQQAGHVAVILPRPDAGLVLYLNQLCRDAHVIGIASNTPLQHIFNSQLATDLRQLRLAVVVVHDGSSRDHSQSLRIEASQLGDHLLGEPITEIVLRGIAGEVLERQHRQHNPPSFGLRAMH
jgi:hypothetical protein